MNKPERNNKMDFEEFVQYCYAAIAKEYERLSTEWDAFLAEIEEDKKRREEQRKEIEKMQAIIDQLAR